MKVTFFGHKNTSSNVEPILRKKIVDLIENQGADTFYVGNQGSFDYIVLKTLKDLKRTYPHIKYTIVLAYMPITRDEFDLMDYSKTIYPDGLENTPKKFAISKRNHWLIDHSDTVITYVCKSIGGAAQFKKIAERKKKMVINLAERKVFLF